MSDPFFDDDFTKKQHGVRGGTNVEVLNSDDWIKHLLDMPLNVLNFFYFNFKEK